MDRRRARRATAACVALAWLLGCAGAEGQRAAESFSPLLWRADAPGGAVLYLLGSVHVGTHRVQDLGRRVADAYDGADELVVEVDLTRTTPGEIVALGHAYGTLPPGETLRDVISPESHSLLAEYLAKRGLPVEGIERMEPWLATATLTALELQAAGYQSELGVDQLFLGRAAGQKPIVGLETVESQLAMLHGLPRRIQELMLLDVLARGDRFRDEAAGLLQAWERGDEDELARLLFSPLEEYPELDSFYETLFFERNQAMCARLRELSGDGRTRFVILGAGHMVGERGIPALLAQHGYRVERLRLPAP
jgi:uncharacterized protein YbaP (TraB family)